MLNGLMLAVAAPWEEAGARGEPALGGFMRLSYSVVLLCCPTLLSYSGNTSCDR
jgi:hypothetical protein